MQTEPERPLQLEIAHVLFLDLVDYSQLPLDRQPRVLEELQGLIRRTPAFLRAEAGGDLLCIPTGDGMALVFSRDPGAAIECALQIADAVRGRADMRLRIGLHSGPIYRLPDINANTNVSGGGINIAQRVMDCGDAGHILLSSAFAELLGQVGTWPLHDLGVCDVKHGVQLHLFNLYTEELGNAELPEHLRPRSAARKSHPSLSAGVRPAEFSLAAAGAPNRPAGVAKVVLLYRRHAEPDEQVLQLLEKQLLGHGYQVFIDRHLTIGVEWAREIERQIRAADVVIPLLSAASVNSEMLAYELEIAQTAAQETSKPRVLPVRLTSMDPLPEPLARLLDRLEYGLWMGPQDDERLVTDLLQALSTLPELPPAVSRARLEPVGGAVPLESQFWVVRPIEADLRAAIARQDSLVLIKGARQMGKSSLLARALHQAREGQSRVVLTDFQTLNTAQLGSVELFYLSLAEWIAAELDLEVMPDEVWNSRRGPSWNFERYLRREVLDRISAPVVWGLDEVDRLFTREFASEVFGLFRSWHNKRALDPNGPWKRLTLAICYATEANLFITDTNQSPFNVGTRLALEDFTFEQVADLNRRYGSPLPGEVEVARYYRLVGGHPYLVRRGLHEMAIDPVPIAAFEAQAGHDEWIFGDHLRRLLVSLAGNQELSEAVRAVLQGRPCPSAENFYHLRAAGVLAGDSPRRAELRCQLYALYLAQHLL